MCISFLTSTVLKCQTTFVTTCKQLTNQHKHFDKLRYCTLTCYIKQNQLSYCFSTHQKSWKNKIGKLNMSSCQDKPNFKPIERKAELIEPPIKLEGEIVKGFGRGSKEIGCPTANFSEEVVESKLPKTFNAGIYLGWAKLDGDTEHVEKAVVSIGWNPFYGNTKKSVETHIIKKFESDLYGRWMKLNLCGYIRPELNFESLDDLITAINGDIEHAKLQLEKQDSLQKLKHDEFLS